MPMPEASSVQPPMESWKKRALLRSGIGGRSASLAEAIAGARNKATRARASVAMGRPAANRKNRMMKCPFRDRQSCIICFVQTPTQINRGLLFFATVLRNFISDYDGRIEFTTACASSINFSAFARSEASAIILMMGSVLLGRA